MNMLVQYDQAMLALSTALNSKQVNVVLKSRDDLEFIKLRARQLRDRQLLADATEYQMRVERWLGTLLREAQELGHLFGRGQPRKLEPVGKQRPATLEDIGIDSKLSMKAKHAAALDQQTFDEAVSAMRRRMASGKAKIVSAVDDSEKPLRRAKPKNRSSFGFLLTDGKPLGRIKLGKLRSRMGQISVELEILKAISHRTGSHADTLALVEDSISEIALSEIINAAMEAAGQ